MTARTSIAHNQERLRKRPSEFPTSYFKNKKKNKKNRIGLDLWWHKIEYQNVSLST